jgi:hypothetical protein
MPRIAIQAPTASPDAGAKGSEAAAGTSGAAFRLRSSPSLGSDANPRSVNAAPLTEDEILGLTAGSSEAASQPSAQQKPEEAAASQAAETSAEPEELKAAFDANPELRRAWHAEKAYREIFPNVEAAREIAAMFPTIEQARAAQSQLAELEQLDSWFFSGQPEAHAELAATVYRMNPAAFRSLAQAINQTLARLDAAGKGEGKPEPQPGQAAAAAPADSTTNDKAAAAPDAQQAGRFASFYQETNAAVVEGLVDSIRAQVDRLLPEGSAAGARNRVVGEIYRELDTSLRANRALAQQVRQAFRSGALDADHQAAVAGLILSRARQALPAVAKRVINEWTTGVLTAADAKVARQRAAALARDALPAWQ